MEKLLNNRGLLISKREEIQRKIRDIGSLPAKSQKNFKTPNSELVIKLHQTKQKLKDYSDVNKKALDQYVHFQEQREALKAKKEELDVSEKAIYDLIGALDQKKDEAIERTFKMVAKYFSEVFLELTGEGTAQLVMERKVRDKEPEAEEGSQKTKMKYYKGVDIKVSFTTSGKQQRMHQLSGGQQSLVALALIFAIQRCDPAPFYVFDEIDSALDDTHRLAVAKMIVQQSKNIQFIITTHRPEIVLYAHKHYLIEYKNKVSNIVSCSKDEALALLDTEDAEEIEAQYEKKREEADVIEAEGEMPEFDKDE